VAAARRTRTVITAERDSKAAHLRAQGRTYRQIATELGVDVAAAYKMVGRAIASAPVEAVNELRAIESERLTAVIAKAWEIVHADHPYVSAGKLITIAPTADGGEFRSVQDAGPVLAALNLIRTTSESLRKLYGLDAPARQTITVITEDAVDAELRRLETEVAALDAEVPALQTSP